MDFAKRFFLRKNPILYKKDYLYHLEDVSVTYGNVLALKSVELKINAGEKIFVTGPSGAGKTTLLKVLAGHEKITSGRIIGPGINEPSSTGFVSNIFQDLKLINSWTVEDNLWVSYDPKIYKSKNKFYEDMVKLCSMLNVKDRLSEKISNLNGGLKQKTAIIRALLARPSVLLADEPTSSLDRDNAFKLYDLLNFYTDQKEMTLVWASHNKDLVRQFSGKNIHIENGRLMYVGHACFI